MSEAAHMPPWLARRLVGWASKVGGRWLDPACGNGALLRAAVDAERAIVGVDVDPASVERAREACRSSSGERLQWTVEVGDGLAYMRRSQPNLVIMDPPHEDACTFVEGAMGCSGRVIALVQMSALADQGWHAQVWSKVRAGEWGGLVALLPGRDMCGVKLWRRPDPNPDLAPELGVELWTGEGRV